MKLQQKKLYRKENRTTYNVRSNNPGSEYRLVRHKQKIINENAPSKLPMKRKQNRGLDYTPLFMFLISRVGESWDAIYHEAVSRLDTPEPIFWLVALHEHEEKDYVRCGESSYYNGLYIDSNGTLQKVNADLTAKDIPIIRCNCCTHTFNGVPIEKAYEYNN
ncbi:hypothetical protein EYY83_12490 [Hafnia alvei]|uniref:hypothetical protein n=1 Tax=Hafnia alvei TaxID=569 RepID=UPI0010338434|nr:hypothetical protein [Hafnia alvei]TBL64061.1 hypothetical protein EYY92_00200 [Hafnia alvei]TBM13641.1 hypothetical protein EYY83_12490 [Hafnia alvei]